ncbi:MAG: NAD(P)-dependent oxidoreductase [Proteobacteria bacterium]|nr:NAD(P)-dependent oxidoreductase [Pseudomonadota bacterium]
MAENLNNAAIAPKRVVVIGAGGFVGSAIVAAARERRFAVLPLGRGEVDLLADGSGQKFGGKLKPGDAVVFVSALAPCKDYVMFEQNIRMAKNALDGLAGQPLSQLLYISSDAVYSDVDGPLTEASVTAPDSLHGQMHVARETMFAAALAETNAKTIFATLRPTLIYGAGDPHNGYGPNRFRRLVLAGDDIVLFGNGEERRDHVSVLDVAELAVRMLERRTRGALNATTGTVASFRELAEMTIGFSDEVIAIENLSRSGPMPHNGYRPFDPSEVLRLFPDFAFTELEAGLRAAFEEVKAAGA